MSDEWKFKLRKQENPGVETPRPRLVTNIPLEPRKERTEPKAERAAQAVPPQSGYVPQAQNSGHGGMTGYPPPVAGGGYAHEYTPYLPPGYPQPYAPPMGAYPQAMPEAVGQPAYGYYAATPAGPVWQPYYPPYGVPQGMPYGYGYPYGMPPMPLQKEVPPDQGIDPRATAQPMPSQPMPFQAAALQGAQPMESRPSGFEPNEPVAEAQAAQPQAAFQAAYPVPQAYPWPQLGGQAREMPQANPVAQTAPAARTVPVEEPSAPIAPTAMPDGYADPVAPAYPLPQWSAPAQGTPQAAPVPEIAAEAQRLEVTGSTPAAQFAAQPEPRQRPMAEAEVTPAPQAYPPPMNGQAREIPQAMSAPEEALVESRPEPTPWQPAQYQAETTVQAPRTASAPEQAPWTARVRQEGPFLQAVQPSRETPAYEPAEGTVERRRRSWRGPEEDGAMAAPVEKAAYTLPFHSQPVDSDAQLVTRDDDDDTGRFYVGEPQEIPTPVTVPLMLNTVGRPAKAKKKGGGGWLWLLPVVLLLGSLSAVFFTGTADSLLMRAGIPTWEELTVEKIPDEDLPSVFAEETAAPGSLEPSLPEGSESDLAGDPSQAAVPASAGVVSSNLPVLSSFTVNPDSGTAPATLVFSMQSNNAVKSIQLAKATGEKLTGKVTSAPSGDGIAWQFEVRFDKAYEGEIHALLEGQEKGGWHDTDLVCRVAVD